MNESGPDPAPTPKSRSNQRVATSSTRAAAAKIDTARPACIAAVLCGETDDPFAILTPGGPHGWQAIPDHRWGDDGTCGRARHPRVGPAGNHHDDRRRGAPALRAAAALQSALERAGRGLGVAPAGGGIEAPLRSPRDVDRPQGTPGDGRWR